jgi:hypothetical protein
MLWIMDYLLLISNFLVFDWSKELLCISMLYSVWEIFKLFFERDVDCFDFLFLVFVGTCSSSLNDFY